MILGIDASNIRRGGGVTHLVELLRAAEPETHGFSKVFVWSGTATLSTIEDRPWLEKCHMPELDGGLLSRTLWQRRRLSECARQVGCDLLFIPGGSFAGKFRPIATLSQNLLPFEWRELRRFGWSKMSLKLLLLRFTQSKTFRKADGLIFLTEYAQKTVSRVIGKNRGASTIIPHGIEQRFSLAPRPQISIEQCTSQKPFSIIYVSILDMYKHQDKVAAAVAGLRAEGLPVSISFIGPAYPPAEKKLRKLFATLDPRSEFLQVTGAIPYTELHSRYQAADMCIFASSCENLPIILLEGMAAGLPIACSNRGPMPEVLKDAGVYFDPENPAEIKESLRSMILNPKLRADLAQKSWQLTKAYSWKRCAADTFEFFAQTARQGKPAGKQ